MNEKQLTKTSKFLSLVLRHQPETIGIELDNNGWTDVKTLIERANAYGVELDEATLDHLVATNSKKRFAFNDAHDKIRANQGHSVDVELGFPSRLPPEILYHGTGEKSVQSIMDKGLDKGSRHHVHLSADTETASKVGQRHGKPFIFEVMAGQMHKDGFAFYISDNGVWLTEHVPAKYLTSAQ
ncbi:MAG: RNA 2'-phosphotransferase [Sphingobacteriales bacterium]|nr:MAG: RNA 2'-phosphotransferase [Sphingobacteriales bacterium]